VTIESTVREHQSHRLVPTGFDCGGNTSESLSCVNRRIAEQQRQHLTPAVLFGGWRLDKQVQTDA